jgi:hypothetical protein
LYLNEALVLRKQADSFDYGAIDAPSREALREHAQTLSRLAQNTAVNLWRMGRILADVQQHLSSSNGTFVQWVKQESGLSIGTAYRLINVHRAFSVSNLETTSFAPSALYLLSEPSAPIAARTEAIQRATNGESITRATAQQIVGQYQVPRPVLPPLPQPPPMPPSPEYRAFEREELMPRLHDTGDPDAPQVLSGQQEELRPVPAVRREQAHLGMKGAIVEAMRGIDTEDEAALGACADEVLEILGQTSGSIAISARLGVALARSPQTLSDLTAITAWVCGECLSAVDRGTYLALRKKTLRLLDSLTLCDGLPVFEHTLSNGQITYSLIEDAPDCP